MADKTQQQRESLFSEDELNKMEGNLFAQQPTPVTCLGMTFESDDARREYFRAELRKKLPELRKIEGFPIGEDDDIINLSDPPYYTACPNPWLNDFVAEWEKEKEQLKAEGKRTDDFEVKEPYATDIKEGKNAPIYNAHSYHTKVPHYVIMNYYLHYTQPGDIVVDDFCGTGMSGVAANCCSFPDDATKEYFNNKWEEEGSDHPNWGKRNCIQGDLSPICSFISYNYTNSIEKDKFLKAANNIFNQLKKELGWLYEFKVGNETVTINYIIWSECQICPNCNEEFVFWDAAVDFNKHVQLDHYTCPHCGAEIHKRTSVKAFETIYDELVSQSTSVCKFVPVVINYTTNHGRFEKTLTREERNIMLKMEENLSLEGVPVSKLEEGDKTSDPFRIGVKYLHQFYTKRNLHILLRFKQLIEEFPCDSRLKSFLRIWFTSCQSRLHRMNRYAVKHHRHVGPMANTLYISATPTEISPFYFIESKISDNTLDIVSNHNVINQVASATKINLANESVDYIFTDPPFGSNIMYSELNFLWESWLKLRTNNAEEAICNRTQNKNLGEYQRLMTESFKEYYRILKPGKWMTVEFSNTKASVWNSLQNALQKAGFIVASVSDLSKGRGGLHGIIGVVAVNQDLAISCYKPSSQLSKKFATSNGVNENVWEFVTELLKHLPIHEKKDNKTAAIIERNPKILYDRLVAYYVQHGYQVPLDATKFQLGLKEHFLERDGMFFTASQAAEYDEKKKSAPEFIPMGIIVSDEANGIQWLKNLLGQGPKTYSEIQPEWMQAMNGLRKGDVLPELMQILDENFIEEANGKWRLPNISDDVDKEALRTKSLLREFKHYVEAALKPKGKIKEARVEALRAGFKDCYIKKDFETIVKVGDRIPQNLLTEDEVLLQFYDIATSKL